MSLETPYSHHLAVATLEVAITEFETLLANAPMQLVDLGDDAANEARGDGKWTRKETLGHLLDSAVNNHGRFVRAQIASHLEGGALRLAGYEQDDWVRVGAYRTRAWTDLIQLWSLFNRQVLHVMRHVDAGSLQTPCVIGGGEPVTLEALMVDYVGHVQHHLAQILEGTE